MNFRDFSYIFCFLIDVLQKSNVFQLIFKDAEGFRTKSGNKHSAYIIFIKMDNSDCWFQQDTQNLIVNFKKRKSVCNHLEMVVTGKNRCFPEVRIRSDQYPQILQVWHLFSLNTFVSFSRN